MADLDVLMHGQLAGRITGGGAGRASFRYDRAHLAAGGTPLSLSMPPSHGPHEAGQWIDGLLPDNPRVREAWAIRSGAASPRPIDLLATDIGHDCAGAEPTPPADPARPRVVLCGAETATGTCGRRLVSRPCPLHPTSPGSHTIRDRTAQQ